MPDEMNQQPTQQPIPEPQIPAPQTNTTQPATFVGNSGLAIAGLVLGILAFLLSFIPLMNLGSIVMGLLGLVLAVVGLISTRNGKHKGKGIAIAGIILSLLALFIVFVMYGSAAAVSESNQKTYATSTATQEESSKPEANAANQENQNQENAQEASTPAEQNASAAEPAATSAEEEPARADYVVNIEGARIGQDFEGNEVAIVTYSWVNNSDEADSFWLVFAPKVFQNNVEVEVGVSMETETDGYMAEVKPGGGTTFDIAYEIKDHSDITVEISPLFDWNNEVIAEQTFSLE